jgi:hypothetical protein
LDSLSTNEVGSPYIFEGAHYRLFSTKGPGFATLYRKFRANGTDHMTTNDPNEGNGSGYVLEAQLGHCPTVPTPQAPKALRRFWNPNIVNHLTAWSQSDINNALSTGYVQEHILCYVQ